MNWNATDRPVGLGNVVFCVSATAARKSLDGSATSRPVLRQVADAGGADDMVAVKAAALPPHINPGSQ